MRRGLVFGKFMPLHRGHQLLIERALAEVDDLTIVVYDSEPTGDYPPMPIELRLRWLRELYPDVEAIVPVDDLEKDNPDNDDPRFARMYADCLRFLGQFDRIFTSEPGYEQFAHELGAKHVIVDAARELVPIRDAHSVESVRAPRVDAPARLQLARGEGRARRQRVDGKDHSRKAPRGPLRDAVDA
jgi:cytidyltransferase-like protein